MNIKYITNLFAGLLLFFLFPSCSDDTTTDYSSSSKDAQIYSFSIAGIAPISKDSVQRAQDSIRFIQVNKTKFAIDQVGGVIYNPDSLPFGTVLDTVAITTTFNPSYSVSKVMITTPDSIKGYSWNLKDSVSLRKIPVTFTVTAADGVSYKSYKIDIRIHKIDPDTLLWQQMASYPSSFTDSKTLLKGNTFYTYGMDGTTLLLYTSDKGSINWTKQTLLGISNTVKLESIFLMNDSFYAIDQSGSAYKSSNGKDWAKLTNGKTITSVQGVVPAITRVDDQLLVIYSNGGKYYFGKTKDLITIEDVYSNNNEVPANFPLYNAASYTNISTNKNQKMLILTGGKNTAGVDLASTWLIKDSQDGFEMSPFVKNSLFKGIGLSTIGYGGKLYALSSNQFYISNLWGESWIVAPNKQKLDSKISARTGQTVIVDDSNYIWIFGGVSANGKGVSDVWKGRLNSLIP